VAAWLVVEGLNKNLLMVTNKSGVALRAETKAMNLHQAFENLRKSTYRWANTSKKRRRPLPSLEPVNCD
jgi:hypothetical protein